MRWTEEDRLSLTIKCQTLVFERKQTEVLTDLKFWAILQSQNIPVEQNINIQNATVNLAFFVDAKIAWQNVCSCLQPQLSLPNLFHSIKKNTEMYSRGMGTTRYSLEVVPLCDV